MNLKPGDMLAYEEKEYDGETGEESNSKIVFAIYLGETNRKDYTHLPHMVQWLDRDYTDFCGTSALEQHRRTYIALRDKINEDS